MPTPRPPPPHLRPIYPRPLSPPPDPPDTPPNSRVLPTDDHTSDKSIASPNSLTTSAFTHVSCRTNFDTEFSDGIYRDGGVLEISSPNINSGAFTDITDPAVGGNFIAGGYTGMIDDKYVWASFRHSVGLAVAWVSPLGPLKVSFAKPLNSKPDDRTQRFQFTFGAAF